MVEIEGENRNKEKVVKLKAITDYKEGVKGVDLGDQLVSSYPAVGCRLNIRKY